MKKRIWIISIFAVLVIGVLVTVLIFHDTDSKLSKGDIVIPNEDSNVESLNKSTLLLQVGNSEQLQVLGTKGESQFASADSKIATVDTDGTVTAISVGQTEITCSVGDKTFVCTVFVCRKGAPTESFTMPDTAVFSAALGSSGGYVGEYAAISLYLLKNAELSGFSITLSYDSETLTLCKADFVGAGIDSGEVYDDQKGNLTLSALSYETNGIVTSDKGSVPCVLLVFKINENAKAGDTVIEPTLVDGDMFVSVEDGSEVLLDTKLYSGKIKIKK